MSVLSRAHMFLCRFQEIFGRHSTNDSRHSTLLTYYHCLPHWIPYTHTHAHAHKYTKRDEGKKQPLKSKSWCWRIWVLVLQDISISACIRLYNAHSAGWVYSIHNVNCVQIMARALFLIWMLLDGRCHCTRTDNESQSKHPTRRYHDL